MKKKNSNSANKKTKHELEEKLAAAFTVVATDYGKLKKSKAIIEKFAKQLSKKVDFKGKAETTAVEETSAAKPKSVKAKAVKQVAETAE